MRARYLSAIVPSHRGLVLLLLSALAAVALSEPLPARAQTGNGSPGSKPALTSTPRISGTPRAGSVLSASAGHWRAAATFTYRWQRCSARAASCVSVGTPKRVVSATGAPATSQPLGTYLVTDHDVGHTIRVLVSARNSSGVASAYARATPRIRDPLPGKASPLMSSDPDAASPMTLISQGQPAFSEGADVYPAANAVSNDYGPGTAEFRCTPPCALAVDLSRVPVSERQKVVVTWYNEDSEFYPLGNGLPYYDVPQDYTIDVNSAAGSGAPPSSGWTTLQTVSGNYYGAREAFLDLHGAKWIRMGVTAINGALDNNDAAFKFDVASANQGTKDTWLFLGDSLSLFAMTHIEPGNYMQRIHAADPGYWPSEIDAGEAGWFSSAPLGVDPNTGKTFISEFLSTFPAHFVALDFGTNDAYESVAPGEFYWGMSHLVQDVLAAHRVPLIATIPWNCSSTAANVPALNGEITQLYQAYPEIVHGPDLYTYFQAHPSLLQSDCTHPTYPAGEDAYRQQWIDAMESAIYANSP